MTINAGALGPSQVNVNPAIGVEGDFASANPRFNVLSGAGAYVAGPDGLYIGRFCWGDVSSVDDVGAAAIANSYGSGPVLGFVHRSQQALITGYLVGSTMLIPPGLPAGAIMNGGDFLAVNTGANVAQPGMKAYANFADGKITFAAAGAPTTGATSTGAIAASTFSVTGTIVGNVMTVTAVGSGVVRKGATISGTGVISGTKVVSQLSGTAGGVGTYAVSLGSQAVTSTTISGTYGTFTAGATTGGAYGLGDVLTGSSVVAGTTITEFITGVGGAGTYAVSDNTVVSSTTISVLALNVETKWFARSVGSTGEIVKISDHPQG